MRYLAVLALGLLLSCKDDDSSDTHTGSVEWTYEGDTGDTGAVDDRRRFTILHTNDWQSHMLGFGPNAEYTPDSTGDDLTEGGLARIKTLVDEIEGSTVDPVLLLDSGDWMSGTLFQLLAQSDAAELRIMQAIGYDAITLGNHEFDWGPQLLGNMIATADANGVEVPILSGSVVPNADDDGDDALEALFDDGRIEATRVLTLDNGLVVGLFGVLGDAAQEITPGVAPSSFVPMVDAATLAVAELQAQDVDLVIAISHSGVADDTVLATEVEGIDFIIGGHSHTALFKVEEVNGVPIVQAGAYTRYLGELQLVEGDGGWEVEAYELHEIDDSIPGDAAITAMVADYRASLDEGALAGLDHDFDEPVVRIPQDIPASGCVETGLGHLITDAYVSAMNATDPSDPIQLGFESQGVIRDGLSVGTGGLQAFSDLFRVLPLGGYQGDQYGYALVDFYVTAEELQGVCEVTASISPLYGCDYFIETSGLRCHVDMDSMPFTKVNSVDLWEDGAWVELDTRSSNTTLYHVAVDSYVASLMSIIGDLTFNLIVITPKDAEGVAYGSWEEMVFDADVETEGVQPMRLWEALVNYSSSLDDSDEDGVPDLPDSYIEPDPHHVGYWD